MFRIDLPRTDFHTTIFGVALDADFASDTEISFAIVNGTGVMKYELALLDSEVNPVLAALLHENLQPAHLTFGAVHNHWLAMNPPLKYLHGFSTGRTADMAAAMRRVLAHSDTPIGHGQEPPGNAGFDVQRVEPILGGRGEPTNGVLNVSVARRETISEGGIVLPSEMQFESVFTFQSIPNNRVASTGEYVVVQQEADPVSRALSDTDILVTALHNHESDVQPKLYYLHSWATGDPYVLAQNYRTALDLTNHQ